MAMTPEELQRIFSEYFLAFQMNNPNTLSNYTVMEMVNNEYRPITLDKVLEANGPEKFLALMEDHLRDGNVMCYDSRYNSGFPIAIEHSRGNTVIRPRYDETPVPPIPHVDYMGLKRFFSFMVPSYREELARYHSAVRQHAQRPAQVAHFNSAEQVALREKYYNQHDDVQDTILTTYKEMRMLKVAVQGFGYPGTFFEKFPHIDAWKHESAYKSMRHQESMFFGDALSNKKEAPISIYRSEPRAEMEAAFQSRPMSYSIARLDANLPLQAPSNLPHAYTPDFFSMLVTDGLQHLDSIEVMPQYIQYQKDLSTMLSKPLLAPQEMDEIPTVQSESVANLWALCADTTKGLMRDFKKLDDIMGRTLRNQQADSKGLGSANLAQGAAAELIPYIVKLLNENGEPIRCIKQLVQSVCARSEIITAENRQLLEDCRTLSLHMDKLMLATRNGTDISGIILSESSKERDTEISLLLESPEISLRMRPVAEQREILAQWAKDGQQQTHEDTRQAEAEERLVQQISDLNQQITMLKKQETTLKSQAEALAKQIAAEVQKQPGSNLANAGTPEQSAQMARLGQTLLMTREHMLELQEQLSGVRQQADTIVSSQQQQKWEKESSIDAQLRSINQERLKQMREAHVSTLPKAETKSLAEQKAQIQQEIESTHRFEQEMNGPTGKEYGFPLIKEHMDRELVRGVKYAQQLKEQAEKERQIALKEAAERKIVQARIQKETQTLFVEQDKQLRSDLKDCKTPIAKQVFYNELIAATQSKIELLQRKEGKDFREELELAHLKEQVTNFTAERKNYTDYKNAIDADTENRVQDMRDWKAQQRERLDAAKTGQERSAIDRAWRIGGVFGMEPKPLDLAAIGCGFKPDELTKIKINHTLMAGVYKENVVRPTEEALRTLTLCATLCAPFALKDSAAAKELAKLDKLGQNPGQLGIASVLLEYVMDGKKPPAQLKDLVPKLLLDGRKYCKEIMEASYAGDNTKLMQAQEQSILTMTKLLSTRTPEQMISADNPWPIAAKCLGDTLKLYKSCPDPAFPRSLPAEVKNQANTWDTVFKTYEENRMCNDMKNTPKAEIRGYPVTVSYAWSEMVASCGVAGNQYKNFCADKPIFASEPLQAMQLRDSFDLQKNGGALGQSLAEKSMKMQLETVKLTSKEVYAGATAHQAKLRGAFEKSIAPKIAKPAMAGPKK